MRSMPRLIGFGLIGCTALYACGSSPPTRFYALNVLAPQGSAVSNAAATAAVSDVIPLRVEPVAIPAELDRLELVSHSGANEVYIAPSERWAAPLDEQVRQVLSDDLAARLPARAVVDPNEPGTQDPRRTLSVSLAQFEAAESCTLTLSASWTLHTPHAPSQSGMEHIEQPAQGSCPQGMAAAMSRALATLADRLAPQLSH
jgi:uncharacterized lipoprotein YmbA